MGKKRFILLAPLGCSNEPQIVYCNCHEDRDEIPEEILKAITTEQFIGRFDRSEFVCINGGGRLYSKDEQLYMMSSSKDGQVYIWAVGSKVKDMVDAVIPHTYYVKKIGMLIDEISNEYMYYIKTGMGYADIIDPCNIRFKPSYKEVTVSKYPLYNTALTAALDHISDITSDFKIKHELQCEIDEANEKEDDDVSDNENN